MIVYFADRGMNILGSASTKLPGGFTIVDDKKIVDIDTGVSTFEGNLMYREPGSTSSTDESFKLIRKMTMPGYFVLRSGDDGTCDLFTILERELRHEEAYAYFYAEDAGLDLLNEMVHEFEAASSASAEWYINYFTIDAGWEVGLNEVSTLTRKLKWEGDATAAERIRSVATEFGAELGYRFDIQNFEVKHKYIDLYQKRGTDSGIQLRYGLDVKSIIEKTSVANLATALRVTGGTPETPSGTKSTDPEPQPITLKNVTAAGFTYYDDGDIFTDSNSGMVKSRNGMATWSRYLYGSGTDEGYIVQDFQYDTVNYTELQTRAVNELKRLKEPELNYEVEMYRYPEDLRIGDTCYLIDDAADLYLQTRVLKIEESAWNGTRVYTFGEYLIQSSGISAKVQALADKFASSAMNRKFYTWIVYAEDDEGTGISTEPTEDSVYIGIATNCTQYEVDISDPTVFTWTKIAGADGQPGARGIDGVSNYIHVRYSDDGGETFTANSGLTPGKYMGTLVTEHPTAHSGDPDITDPSEYTWVRTKAYETVIVQDDNELFFISENPAGEETTTALRDGVDAVTLRIDSSKGVLFKSNNFSTVLTVTIQKGVQIINDILGLRSTFGSNAYLQWQFRKFDDESWRTMLVSDEHITDNGFSLTITPDDVDEKIVFKCDLITDDEESPTVDTWTSAENSSF